MNRDALAFLATCSDVREMAGYKDNVSTSKCQDDDGESLIDESLPRLPRQVQRFTAKLKVGGKGNPTFRDNYALTYRVVRWQREYDEEAPAAAAGS